MFIQFLAFLVRQILSLRYNITIEGLQHIKRPEKGTLILPNHPAYTEPIILFSLLAKNFSPRPLVFEAYYQNIFIKPFMLLFNALEIPNLEKVSLAAKSQAQGSIKELVKGLEKGENFIIWPSGKLQRNGLETLGSNSGTSDILKLSPNANVLLIRTTGLWGSRFSHAYTGSRPSLIPQLIFSAFLIFLNFLFFMPRRKIHITIEKPDLSKLSPFEKFPVNQYLENWYNQPATPSPIFRPYHFLFQNKEKIFPPLATKTNSSIKDVFPQSLKKEIIQKTKEKFPEILIDENIDESTELDSLGLDSIQRLELLIYLEQHFKFNGTTVPSTFFDLCMLCSGKLKNTESIKVPDTWSKSTRTNPEFEILGTTVLDSFILRVMKSPNLIALIDDTSGIMTYRKLLLASLVTSKILRGNQAKHVGILLPASAGGFIAYFACLMAEKTPVLLNWTTGPANLKHAIELLGITKIITSKRFMDRVELSLDNIEFIFLEKVKSSTNALTLLTCAITSYFPKKTLKECQRSNSKDSIAAILFTSGSEKLPKAVPLTNENIISNHKSGIPFLGLSSQDIILSFLPPFHSFGLSVTGLLPILLGMRIVFHPNPTEAAILAEKLKVFDVTLLIGTPTFLTHILEKASKDRLKKLRLIITGAEKCTEKVFQLAKEIAPNAKVLEGYGITECSPVVAVNPPSLQKRESVGKPLPGVDVLILDIETNKIATPGQTGMLHVSGPTIFNGYLGEKENIPFRHIDNKKWYVTGDLVSQDEDGFIFFKGRLKRFIKFGGEMISLPALEEAFSGILPPDEKGPMIAIEGIEKGNKKIICLFTRKEMEPMEANQILDAAGFRGIMRIDRVIKVNEIPLLGTGKTNYRKLKEQIEKESQEA